MLCFQRKTGQSFDLNLPDGRKVTITALYCARGRVRLGVSAPVDVAVQRDDIHEPAPAAIESMYELGNPVG
jgi:sRNA-binding carbon storage regulator CsrA